ncbi:TIGR04141 family sporadically distributed protein, partial [Streptomyces sp. IBSBF 2953]|nr:TIGR04141 family sporadically distributed protein [Streptomyces hayashii]
LWVDNVRKIKEKSDIDRLDQLLLDAIKNRDPRLVITLPEIEKWDSIIGFSFTRAKNDRVPIISSDNYLNTIDNSKVTIDTVKRDNLYVFDIYENEFSHSIYK